MEADSLLFRLLEFYGTRIEHRGQGRVHQALRRIFAADIDQDFEVVRKGLKWRLNPSDFVQSEFFWTGDMEHWESYHLARLLKPPMVIFDVGANFGYYSVWLAALLKRQCRVYAFEPNPTVFTRLVANIELNGLSDVISPECAGLSDTAQRGFFVIRPRNTGATRMQIGSDECGIEVCLTTVDEFCTLHEVDGVDFIKIDVEGCEERVLKGAQACIAQYHPLLLVELNSAALASQNSSTDRVVALLREHGYQMYVPRRKVLLPLEQLAITKPHVNTFCLQR